MDAAGGPSVLQRWAEERDAAEEARIGREGSAADTTVGSATRKVDAEAVGRAPHPDAEKEALLSVFERLEVAAGACDISFS